MLEGRNLNLRVVEKGDLPQLAQWFSTPEVFGEFNPLRQISKTGFEEILESPNELKLFFIEKKDGNKIGFITHFYVVHVAGRLLEIGYSLVPGERGKGYCTEALEIMVDYLFLSRDAIRVQATTDIRNVGSQRVLEKASFKKEGTLRRLFFIRGEWRDAYVYSILREDWKKPKILTEKKAES